MRVLIQTLSGQWFKVCMQSNGWHGDVGVVLLVLQYLCLRTLFNIKSPQFGFHCASPLIIPIPGLTPTYIRTSHKLRPTDTETHTNRNTDTYTHTVTHRQSKSPIYTCSLSDKHHLHNQSVPVRPMHSNTHTDHTAPLGIMGGGRSFFQKWPSGGAKCFVQNHRGHIPIEGAGGEGIFPYIHRPPICRKSCILIIYFP